MTCEYQDKGWEMVDYMEHTATNGYVQTFAMQQGVGVFLLVIQGKVGGGRDVGDPVFVPGAVLEAVESSKDGWVRIVNGSGDAVA